MKNLSIAIFTIASIMFSAFTFAESVDPTATAENVILYVDINNDSAEKMADLLKGIGMKKAQAIIDYRDEHGRFEAIEDLLDVPGIGPATLEKNRLAILTGETEY